MTIGDNANDDDSRIGVGRVRIQVVARGAAIPLDGQAYRAVQGRVLRNGPESEWAPGQNLAFAASDPVPMPGLSMDIDARRVWALRPEEPGASLLPLLWPMVLDALDRVLQPAPDSMMLVHGADTLAGMLALIATAKRGCSVLAVCHDRAGARLAIQHGAHEAALYSQPWAALLREHGAADYALDPYGGRQLQASLPCLKRGAHAALWPFDDRGAPAASETAAWAKQLTVSWLGWSPLRDGRRRGPAHTSLPSEVLACAPLLARANAPALHRILESLS